MPGITDSGHLKPPITTSKSEKKMRFLLILLFSATIYAACGDAFCADADTEALSLSPLYLAIQVHDKPDILLKIDVKSWSNSRDNAAKRVPIDNATPYIFMTGHLLVFKHQTSWKLNDIPNFKLKFFSEPNNSIVAFYKEDDGSYHTPGYDQVNLAACPSNIQSPKLDDCLTADAVDVQMIDSSGNNKKYSGYFDTQFLFKLLQVKKADQNTVNEISKISSNEATSIIEDSEKIAKQRESQQRAAFEKNQRQMLEANEVATKIREEENRNAINIIDQAPPRSSMFCDSGDGVLLMPGKLITSMAYKCDLTGNKFWSLRTILSHNWNIVNEIRTPYNTISGETGYEVSLQLRKGQ